MISHLGLIRTFPNVPHQPQEVLDKMTPEQLSAWKHSLVLSVQTPYMIIVAIVLLVALLIVCTRFPSLQSDDHSDSAQSTFFASLTRLMRIRHWRWAVLAQFCYVGAQTACWSYLIRYAIEEIPGMTAGFAANYLTATMVCFFIGRFTGTWLIRRFAPHNVLAIYAFIAMLLCLLSAFSGGHVGLLALTLCSAFMSIQYPTIFSLGIKHLGQDTKYGSSFIVMTIIGGGIVTPVMGFVSDAAGNIPTAELVPALCFAIIFIFARFRSQAATN